MDYQYVDTAYNPRSGKRRMAYDIMGNARKEGVQAGRGALLLRIDQETPVFLRSAAHVGCGFCSRYTHGLRWCNEPMKDACVWDGGGRSIGTWLAWLKVGQRRCAGPHDAASSS